MATIPPRLAAVLLRITLTAVDLQAERLLNDRLVDGSVHVVAADVSDAHDLSTGQLHCARIVLCAGNGKLGPGFSRIGSPVDAVGRQVQDQALFGHKHLGKPAVLEGGLEFRSGLPAVSVLATMLCIRSL
jgi:hypothetical protein